METQTARAPISSILRADTTTTSGIGGGLVAHGLGQLEDVRLDKVRLELERFEQQLALRVDDQLAAVLLDQLAQLQIVLERELRRRGAGQDKDIPLAQIAFHPVDQTEEIRVLQLAARLVDLGMPALRINNLRIDALLPRDIDKIVVDVRSGQHILHDAAIGARAKAERNAVAAQRLDRARNVDALAARLQMAGGRTVELADHQRMLDALRAVKRGD